MAGETVITIIGNLTDEPEIRTIGSGAAVASFTIASTPRTWNRNSNQFEDGQALFLRCSAWRDMAEHCAQSLHKGMRVIAQGRLQQRSYQAQDGSNRTVIELQVDEIGPSLRYATAQVQKIQRGGYQGAPQAGFNNPPSNGFQQSQQAGQQPAQSQQLGGDPWASNNNQPSDFGNFGGNTDEF
nr:MAG TPA: Single stranded DNA binding protein [Caudoviricetes sp.]